MVYSFTHYSVIVGLQSSFNNISNKKVFSQVTMVYSFIYYQLLCDPNHRSILTLIKKYLIKSLWFSILLSINYCMTPVIIQLCL